MEKLNIIFDVDNTLTDFRYTDIYAISCIYNHLGLPFSEDEYNKYKIFHDDFWYKFENSDQKILSVELDPIDYIRSKMYIDYFKSLNLSIKEGYELLQIYINTLGVKNLLYEYVEEVLDYLYQKYSLFIGSNGPTESQIRKLKGTNILKYFKDIITAEDCKYSKPNPLFFQCMLKRFGISAEESVFVGDSLSSDIAGANNSNIYSIWYNRNKVINSTSIIPNKEITDIRELKKIL